MSGFTNITGFALPTSLPGFLGLLQTASFRGVPFKVVASGVRKGRRLAVHEYPFRDGGWPEDLGRSLRVFSMTGYLIGDLAPVLQLALDGAAEKKGPGTLVHPTLGMIQVALLSYGTALSKDRSRVVEVHFEFLEAGTPSLLSTIISTVLSVVNLAVCALAGCGASLGGVAAPAALQGSAVTGEGQTVVAAFVAATVLGGADPGGIVAMATALPPPDSDTTYGRYAAGSATANLPVGTTVATLQSQLAVQRQTTATAGSAAVAAIGAFSAATDLMTPLSATVEAMRSGITNPADQLRILQSLAAFSFEDGAGGSVGIGAAQAIMRDATAAACRRAALVSLALASAAYQPTSYNDAAAVREAVAAALDVEITAAGDAGEDDAYTGLKQLRAAVVRDLTTRGASLPSTVPVTTRVAMPSLALAQTLYRDAGRADEIAAEAGAIHPAFCPTSFLALAS
jgi:prophage DNA circulation protein